LWARDSFSRRAPTNGQYERLRNTKAFSVRESAFALSDFRQTERTSRFPASCCSGHGLWPGTGFAKLPPHVGTHLRLITEHYPPLASLPRGLCDRLDAEGRPLHAHRGDVLFDVGDPCVAVPLLAWGLARVTRPLPTGRDVPLYMLAAGDFCVLSLAGALSNMPCPARATVIEAVEGVLLPNALFLAMVGAHEPFRCAVFQLIGVRLLALTAVIEGMAVETVEKRLAQLLVARGPVVRATHQALAEELGTAREVISRILEHFEAQGLVALRRSEVRVTAPQRLVHSGAAGRDESE
jgi:CRP/FNR family transcriptional regulator